MEQAVAVLQYVCIRLGSDFYEVKFMALINPWGVYYVQCTLHYCTLSVKNCTICSLKICFTFLTVLLLLPNTNQLRLDRCGQTGLTTFCSALNDVGLKVQKVRSQTFIL